MQEITLTNGSIALVDDEDFVKVASYKWRPLFNGNTIYAYATLHICGHYNVNMHRFILGIITKPELFVDHIDGDGLNNQKSNLRIATRTENNRNCKVHGDNKLGVKGVCRRKSTGKYQASIGVNGKQLYIGDFETLDEASEAYNKAAIKYYGEFAKLNQ